MIVLLENILDNLNENDIIKIIKFIYHYIKRIYHFLISFQIILIG